MLLPVDAPIEIAIVIERVAQPVPSARVSVACAGHPSGRTVFEIAGQAASATDLQDEVHGVVATAAGAALPVEHRARTWSVTHAPSAPVTLTYHLVPARDGPGHEYRVKVTPAHFHAIGDAAFVLPQHLDGWPRTFSLAWRGYARAVSSFGDGDLTARVDASTFRHAVFLAGDIDVVTRRVRDRAVRVAMTRDPRGLQVEELAIAATRVIGIERDFFDDHTQERFLITALFAGEADERASPLGGTHLHDSVALFLPAGATRARHGVQLDWLLAHECFHHWNGGVIRRAPPDSLTYWFSEGFTNFYARRLLARAGLLDGPAWVADLNVALSGYADSPVRDAPGDRVAAEFWSSRHAERLPYLRGDLVAMMVDAAIARASQDRRSLDDLMRDLARAGRRGDEVSNDSLIAAIARETSPEFAARIRAIVRDGARAEPPATLSEGRFAARLAPARAWRYEPGFDVGRTLATKVVHGVKRGAAAYRAGLRDGQEVAGYSFVDDDADRPVQITVRIEGAERALEFLPRGASYERQLYVLAPKE
jgi:predicted metalloprotease with PDZ domain